MSGYGTTSRAAAFKAAFYNHARTVLFAPGEAINEAGQVETFFGRPVQFPPDIVAFGAVRSTQEHATMGTNRSREEQLELDITISVQRGGRDDDQYVSDRAYEILGILEEYARVTDTTIGDTVIECALVRHTSEGATTPEVRKHGPCVDINATFAARARVRSS